MNLRRLLTAPLAALVAALTLGPSLSAQNRADRQSLEDESSFSMILLGDPQGYVKYDLNQPLLELCTAWIADNVDNLNIKAVLCTGDLVEQNENIVMDRSMLNQTSREMWESVSRSFARLDGVVPYIIAPGNHDYGYKRSENTRTCYPEYFPFERNSCWRDRLVSACPNRNGDITIENAAFELEDGAWGKMLVITTEHAPCDAVLDWARDLIDSEKYRNHKGIFITHNYLREKSAEFVEKVGYKLAPSNSGKQIWEKLIRDSHNIILTICGHTGRPAENTWKGEPDDWSLSCAYRCDTNPDGNPIHQMMFNVQVLGGGWEGNGGDGWLRILEFKPDGRTISVRTYSPLFGISHLTKHLAHRTGACDQFDMVIGE